MKKIIYIIINIIISCHTLFGFVGFLFSLSDLFGMVLFGLWTASGVALLFVARMIYKSLTRSAPMESNKHTFSSSDSPSTPSMPEEKTSAPSASPAVSSPEIHATISESPAADVPFEPASLSETGSPDNSVAAAEESISLPDSAEPPTFPDAYLVLDVETPNRKNDRISQIGLLLVENGHIRKNYSTLINPEVTFDPINTTITGLDSNKVSRAPVFTNFWPRVSDLFKDYVVVAHNADFDLNVLKKTIFHYGYPFPAIQYVCTYVESMNKFSELPSHKLTDIAKHLGVNVDIPHNASHDAEITMQVFEKMKSLRFDFPIYDYPEDNPPVSVMEDTPAKSTPLSSKKGGIDYGYSQDNFTIDIPFSDLSEIPISGKRFVLTGVFSFVDRDAVSAYIESHGGQVLTAVSSRTDFLVVGAEREPAWKHGNYGRKIEKAIELINNGSDKIKIIKEQLFITLL